MFVPTVWLPGLFCGADVICMVAVVYSVACVVCSVVALSGIRCVVLHDWYGKLYTVSRRQSRLSLSIGLSLLGLTITTHIPVVKKHMEHQQRTNH